MTYSYTQIASYLRCPRSYRYRYLDGWREKDNRPALLFGRCFTGESYVSTAPIAASSWPYQVAYGW